MKWTGFGNVGTIIEEEGYDYFWGTDEVGCQSRQQVDENILQKIRKI